MSDMVLAEWVRTLYKVLWWLLEASHLQIKGKTVPTHSALSLSSYTDNVRGALSTVRRPY